MPKSRSFTRPALMKGFWEILFASIRFAIKCLVSSRITILRLNLMILVASKCGIDCFGDGSVTNSASHIKAYIDGTIERLGFTPDLYYLHRIDPSEFN